MSDVFVKKQKVWIQEYILCYFSFKTDLDLIKFVVFMCEHMLMVSVAY